MSTPQIAQPLYLDEMLDSTTLAGVEKAAAEAIARDRTLRQLVAATPLLKGAIALAVKACLHLDPLALLADGWATADDLKTYRDAGKAEPHKTWIVKLASHAIERGLQPAITIELGHDQSFTLNMGLMVEGAFEGVELSLRDARIVAVGSGLCRLSVKITAAGQTIAAQALKDVRLPGEYAFTPAIELY